MSDIELRPGGASGPPRVDRAAPVSWLRSVFAILHDATDGLFRHDGIMVASAISYSLIFALFPFIIFLVALGAMVGGGDLADYVTAEALMVLPENIIATLKPELDRIFLLANSASPLTFGLLVTLISITGAVEGIRDGLNRAYMCAEDRHMVRRYVSSLLFVFAGMAFVLVAAALGIAVPIGIDLLDRFVPGPELQLRISWLETMREGLLVVVTLAMLFSFHLFLPAKRRSVGSVTGGVFLTLVGWWLSGKLFGLYITTIANYTATYAGLAGIVILMFFLYIQAVIFLYGAELNRSIADLRGDAVQKDRAGAQSAR
jgi:membrane protein